MDRNVERKCLESQWQSLLNWEGKELTGDLNSQKDSGVDEMPLKSNGGDKVLIHSLVIFSEKAMASHSSTLAWKIPWMEEPGGLQSMGLLRVGHD